MINQLFFKDLSWDTNTSSVARFISIRRFMSKFSDGLLWLTSYKYLKCVINRSYKSNSLVLFIYSSLMCIEFLADIQQVTSKLLGTQLRCSFGNWTILFFINDKSLDILILPARRANSYISPVKTGRWLASMSRILFHPNLLVNGILNFEFLSWGIRGEWLLFSPHNPKITNDEGVFGQSSSKNRFSPDLQFKD